MPAVTALFAKGKQCWLHHPLLATIKDDTLLMDAPIYTLFSMPFLLSLLFLSVLLHPTDL